MKTKGIVLSLMASTLINIPSSFAKNYKNSTELTQAKKSKFEFYPVKLSKTELKDGLNFEGNSYLQLTKRPALVIEDFKYQSLVSGRLGLKLVLSEKQIKKLNKVLHKYNNTKLAVVYNDELLMAPAIKSLVVNKSMELIFKSPKRFENLLSSFKKV